MSSRVELLFHFCVNTLRESDQKLRYKRRGITSPFLMTSLVIKNLFLQVGQTFLSEQNRTKADSQECLSHQAVSFSATGL